MCASDFHFLGSSNDLNLRSKNIYVRSPSVAFHIVWRHCNGPDLGTNGLLALSSVQEDKQILKFMDWCLFLTDNKLCHVVFVRNTTASYSVTQYSPIKGAWLIVCLSVQMNACRLHRFRSATWSLTRVRYNLLFTLVEASLSGFSRSSDRKFVPLI